jgi:hypothetical protein
MATTACSAIASCRRGTTSPAPAVIPPATNILFHNTIADGNHYISTSSANLATLDAGGVDRGHGADALLFRDHRVGELGSAAASNGLNTGSHITDGSSTDYRTVR